MFWKQRRQLWPADVIRDVGLTALGAALIIYEAFQPNPSSTVLWVALVLTGGQSVRHGVAAILAPTSGSSPPRHSLPSPPPPSSLPSAEALEGNPR